jgi:hypothetical protein
VPTLQDLGGGYLLTSVLLLFVVLFPGRRDDCAHVVLQLSLLAGLLCSMNQPYLAISCAQLHFLRQLSQLWVARCGCCCNTWGCI